MAVLTSCFSVQQGISRLIITHTDIFLASFDIKTPSITDFVVQTQYYGWEIIATLFETLLLMSSALTYACFSDVKRVQLLRT